MPEIDRHEPRKKPQGDDRLRSSHVADADAVGMPPGAGALENPDEPGGLVTNTDDEAPSG